MLPSTFHNLRWSWCDFFNQNYANRSKAMKMLSSIRDLYHIIDRPRDFYPFDVIKAHEMLSLLTAMDGKFQEKSIKKLTVNQFEEVIQATFH